MAVYEKNVLLTAKDAAGDKHLLYPITKLDCVDGADDLLHYGQAQELTDEEKEQARANIGAGEPQVQADWSQNDETAADYVKNRTHWVEETTVSEPLTITWDGSTEGLVSATGAAFYRASDLVLTDEQIKSGTYTDSAGPMDIASIWEQVVSAGFVTEDIVWIESIAFVRKANATFDYSTYHFEFPECGVYFNVSNSSFTTTVNQTKTVYYELPENFIPDTIARVDEIPDAVVNPSTASVGQTIVVKAVDDTGKPTEWEATDLPAEPSSITNDQIDTIFA